MTDVKEKIANPLNFYKNPLDVDKDESLKKEDRVKILQNWLDDIKLRQIAEEENMPSTHPSRYHIAEIEKLLNKYEKDI